MARPVPRGTGQVVPAPVAAGREARSGASGELPERRVDWRTLEAALVGLRTQVARAPLQLEDPGVAPARVERAQIISQIDDYLLPRLRRPAAPLLIAMVGSTGAGKSTLLNSIVGAKVSATGVRRPTTNSPVLACHPDDVQWFAENLFLPTLPRVRQQGLAMPGRDGLLVLATSEGMPEGVALLDTPDIDSVVELHRQFARQFLDASDLWLFVTTARRYADAAVWEMLKDARDRGASLGIVLSRVPPAGQAQLTEHFDAMLAANGLGDVQRFVVIETTVTDSRLPPAISAPVRVWLTEAARRDERRVAILTQTMAGALDSFVQRVPALAEQVGTQLELRAELRSAAGAAYAAGLAELDEAIRNGSLLRGEVLARWQDLAGTGDLLAGLEPKKGQRGGRRSRRQALPARALALRSALSSSLEALVTALGDRAAEDAIERWQASPAGAALVSAAARAREESEKVAESYPLLREWAGDFAWGRLADGSGLSAGLPEGGVEALARSTPDFPRKAAQAVAAWHEHLLHQVRTENVTRRSISRVASFDAETLALILTIGVLGYGAGDVIVSEGTTSAVPQQLLTSLFGAGRLRDIGGHTRQGLHQRISELFSAEAARFTKLIDAVGSADESAPADLYQASYALESAR